MAPTLGSRIRSARFDRLTKKLSPWLMSGEDVQVAVRTNSVKPFLDFVLVTNARVLAVFTTDIPTKGPTVSVDARDITSVEIRDRVLSRLLVIHATDAEVKLGATQDVDDLLITSAIETLRDAGVPPEMAEVVPRASLGETSRASIAGAILVGQEVSEKAAHVLYQHAQPNETPWLIISAGAMGALAAFDDRLLIIKVGALTSALSGTFGGGRVSVFPYSEITGIEYNSGLMNGVLEILTPSYAGGVTKDFWSTGANDPLKQSNTIPLVKPLYEMAVPHLNDLRKRISDSKRSQFLPSPAAQPSLSEELARLGDLRQQGVLDEEEFKEAKRSLINRDRPA